MSTCENCGKSFEPVASLEEVSTLRVLCPGCSAERAAAKARKAALAAGGRPASAPGGAAASARPVAGARPAASAAPGAAHAARPASAPVPAKKLQPRAEAPAPAPAQRPAPKPAAHGGAPAPAAARNNRPALKKKKVEVELHSQELKKKGTREVIVSFSVAVVVFAVAGVVLWKVLGKHKAESDVEKARLARIEQFRKDLAAFDIATVDGAQKEIDFQEANKALWSELDFAGDVVSITAKARTFLETQQEKQELERRLTEIEGIMAKAAELPPSDLADQLRRMDELKTKAPIVGAEFEARLEKDRTEGVKVHLERLMATAQAAAATEPMDKTALATLATTEDEVFKLLDGAAKLLKKNGQDPALKEKEKEYEDDYKTVLRLNDAATEGFFTNEVVDAQPWRDLLADKSAWKVAEVKGFQHNLENGTLTLIGPDPTEKDQGVMSIGDKEVWRDFVVEMELTITKGKAEFFFRLPLNFQENVESRELAAGEGGDENLEAGRTYLVEFRVIGSTLMFINKTEETAPPTRDSISWPKIRKGAFGLGVPRQSELKITKMRAKVLR